MMMMMMNEVALRRGPRVTRSTWMGVVTVFGQVNHLGI